MQALPDVLAQLVFTLLPPVELMQLARCSRALMHAADSPVAWASAILRVSSTKLPAECLSSSRLLRHARVSLVWTLQRGFDRELEPTLDLFPRLTELDLTGCYIVGGGSAFFAVTSSQMDRVLKHPHAKRLRAFHIHRNMAGAITEKTAQRLCKLPVLDTLSVMQSTDHPNDWKALAHARKLTSLSFGVLAQHSATVLDHIAGLKLRELRLASAVFKSGEFLRFFSGPQMSQLHVLTLSACRVSSSIGRVLADFQSALDDRAEHVAAFAAMKQLRDLHLESVGIDELLSAVRHAPALQLVTILPAKGYWAPPALPPLPVVCELLSLRQLVRVTFLHDMPYSAKPRGPLTVTQQLRLCYPQVSDGTMDHAILLAERIRFERRPIDFEIDYGHP